MKINGLTIETVKGKYGRYGLSTEPGRMVFQRFSDKYPFMTEQPLTAEQCAEFADEQRKACGIMLGELSLCAKDKQQSEQPKPAEKPAPKPWKPAAGEMVQITVDHPGQFDIGSIVKIEFICTCGEPVAKNKRGVQTHLYSGSYLPVRREDRPAKVGEWVEITKPDCSQGNYCEGSVLKIIGTAGAGSHAQYGHGFVEWLYDKEYRVLVPYDPQEAEHA